MPWGVMCCGCGRVVEKRDPWGVWVDAEAVAVSEAKDAVMMPEKDCTKDEAVRQALNYANPPDESVALFGGEDQGD